MIEMRLRLALPTILAVLMLSLVAACGGDDGDGEPTAQPDTPTVAAPSVTPTIAEPTATSTPEPSPTETAPEPTLPPPGPTATPFPPGPSPTPGTPVMTERWIDVNVTTFVVRLMNGETVVQEIAPVGVGVQIDTGEYLSTQTGVFSVNTRNPKLVYDAPFDTYISHWVGFDPIRDNGFHSFLKDAEGNVVDASTGRVSNGCIRTGEPEAIYAFSEIGMAVVVHY